MPPVPDDVRARMRALTTQSWAADGVVDLGIGQPDDALLPVDLLAAALSATAAAGDRYPLQYGVEPGDGLLRVAIAEYLEPHYGFCADPAATFVTNGNSQAIDLVAGTCARPGDVVLVEDTTYFLALTVFRDHRLRVEPVATDDDGIVPAALEEALRRHRPALLYTVPTFHNPTGSTLPASRRTEVVELASRHGCLVVADEVYHLLSYPTGPDDVGPPPPMAAVAGDGVLSLGTFSKILAPGLRLGWVHASADVVQRFGRRGSVTSGGGLNPLVAAVVTRALADGSAAGYLHRLRGVLADRLTATDAALREHLPPDVTWRRPLGGYFFWLRLPTGLDADTVRAAARAHGVDVRPGHLFSPVGGHRDRVRLSFAYYDRQTVVAAVAALGRALAGLGR